MHNYRITSTLWLYQELSYFILDTPNETRRHSLENQDIDSNKEKSINVYVQPINEQFTLD
jgi:hypothetical protein